MSRLVDRWRQEAEILRGRGATLQADVLLSCATDLEADERAQALEPLTLQEAARESGYSYSALQKLVATGKLPNVGSPHRPRVRRGLLPRKVGTRPLVTDGPDLAARVLQGKARAGRGRAA